MDDSKFDCEALFDEDCLYFYESGTISPERTEYEVDLIWRLLDLKPGLKVLDLACGHGRISNRLAERGCEVTGLDTLDFFLEKARRDAAARGVSVEYVQGDMRSLPWIEQFDCIINWFTAYGYFNDEDNQQVLVEAHRALKSGGKLLLDHQNRDRELKNFHPAFVSEKDGNYLIDRNRYNVLTGQLNMNASLLETALFGSSTISFVISPILNCVTGCYRLASSRLMAMVTQVRCSI